MIRRDDGSDWLLIPQIEHAHVAGEIADAWGNGEVPPFPDSDELLAAVRHHDDGWRKWDTTPQLDLQTGVPRSFLEMPMPVATEIWSRSIDICSRSASSWRSGVRASGVFKPGEQATAEMQARVLDVIEGLTHPFRAEDVVQQLRQTRHAKGDVGALAYRALHLLELGGWLKKVGDGDADPRFQGAWPFDPPSPLAGIAVSKHFAWLAEQARDSRGDDAEERSAVERFLEAQRNRQDAWSDVAGKNLFGSSSELNEAKERGYRAVQFFDRLSLWLCCAARTEALKLECPGRGMFCFSPLSTFRVRIDPFPLSLAGRNSLDLSVSAKRIPARRYADGDDLLNALHDSAAETLTWSLVR